MNSQNALMLHNNNHTHTHLTKYGNSSILEITDKINSQETFGESLNVSDWYTKTGLSSQVVTIQGKNLWRTYGKTFPYTLNGITIDYDSVNDEYILSGTGNKSSSEYFDLYLIAPTNKFCYRVLASEYYTCMTVLAICFPNFF
jgi:hypothetical protein